MPALRRLACKLLPKVGWEGGGTLLGMGERLPGLASLLSSPCAHLLLAQQQLGGLLGREGRRFGSQSDEAELVSAPVPGSLAVLAERAVSVVVASSISFRLHGHFDSFLITACYVSPKGQNSCKAAFPETSLTG